MKTDIEKMNRDLAVDGREELSGMETEMLEQEERLEEVTVEIRTLNRQAGRIMLSYAIEIGKRLAEAKELVGHGRWGDYLENEVAISPSSAKNFIRVYETYGDQQISLFDSNRQAFGDLSYTKALALLSLPDGERDAFVAEHNVEEMSTRELQAAIKERDEARVREEEAKVEQRLAEEAKAKLEKEMTMANERVRGLEEELKALRDKPVEVAVEKTVDEEALAKARKEAAAEAEKKVLDKLEKAQAEAKKAKEALEKAKEDAKAEREEKERALQQKEQAKAETERLKKELSASGNKTVATFGVYYAEVQNSFGKLLDCLEEQKKAGDTENHTKLTKAAEALVENFKGRVGEGDGD